MRLQTQTKEEYNMTKYLISAAVAALMSMPVMAETVNPGDCVVVDHGGYKAFARGCEKLNGPNGRDREVDSEDTDGGEGDGGDTGGDGDGDGDAGGDGDGDGNSGGDGDGGEGGDGNGGEGDGGESGDE